MQSEGAGFPVSLGVQWIVICVEFCFLVILTRGQLWSPGAWMLGILPFPCCMANFLHSEPELKGGTFLP